MSIYKQENKIIRNLAGEVLAESIDTKILAVNPNKVITGNLVNEITSNPMPHKFKALAGQEPQIIDNYLDFTSTHTELQGKGFDYSNPFIIEMSYNWTYTGVHRIYSQWNYPTASTYYIRFSASTSANDQKRISLEAAGVTFTTKVLQVESSVPIGGEWGHYLAQFDGVNLSEYTNGYLRIVRKMEVLGIYAGKGVFGSNQGYPPYNYQGLSGGLCISTKPKERFNGWDTINDVVKYPTGVQAFTPPLLPNTIL